MRLWTNTHLFTTDIDSLHTDINTELRPKTIETILKGHRDPKMSSQVDSIYRWRAQQWGIGKPPHMHICRSQWEQEALAKCPQKPTFFLRYLDDIIGAWSHGEEKFCKVINVLNNRHGEI